MATTDPPQDRPSLAEHRPPPALRTSDWEHERTDVAQLHAPIVREKREPREGHEPVSLWLVVIFGVLLFWGGWYLAQFSGGWSSGVFDERPAARFALAAQPAGSVDPAVLGERLYKANCVSCHQAGGQGVPGQYPPLAGSEWVVKDAPRLKRILLHGLEGPVNVLGNTYNGNMPPFGARLNDNKLAAVLTYIRQAWGNQAPSISPGSVAATRDAARERNTPWSAGELLRIDQPDYRDETPPPESPETSQTPAAPSENGGIP